MHVGVRKYRQQLIRLASRDQQTPNVTPQRAQWSVVTSRETCVQDREASDRLVSAMLDEKLPMQQCQTADWSILGEIIRKITVANTAEAR